MFKEGDFIHYHNQDLLILNNKWGEYSFYIVLRRTWIYDDKYEVSAIPIKEHLAIINNDNLLKLDFMEAILKGKIRYPHT